MKSQDNLKTLQEWYVLAYDHGFNGLVGLEQAYKQSIAAKVCVSCLGKTNLVLERDRALIKSSDYYLCRDCADYYERRMT